MSAAAPLPYAWVRSHGVMLSEVGGEPVLLGTVDTAAWAVAELRRRHGPLPFQALDATTWQQRLAEQYRDGGDAAAVVGAAESEVDLDRLMTRLRQDRRHDGLRILSERAVEQRRFGDWAMVRLDAPPAATTFLEQHLDAPDAGARAEALLIEASRSMAVAP